MSNIEIHEEVRAALAEGRPVVALESAVITHGLPAPDDLDTARGMMRAVRDGGGVPATIAVLDGSLHVGLDDDALARLAAEDRAEKIAAGTLAHALARGATGGTTVSATLVACRRAEPAPIRVFATGGIGGVHPGWARHLDVSADLMQLRCTPVCVVCAGAKSILDLPATLEALESLGVPVVGYRTDHFPRFHLAGTAALPVPMRVDDARAAAAVCHAQWERLELDAAVLLAAAVPDDAAMEEGALDAALTGAEEAAQARGVTGAARTPFVLAELARRTGGRSIAANVALLLSNARLAADVAAAIADSRPRPAPRRIP